MNPQIPDLAARLREITDKGELIAAMKTYIASIPNEDARFRQTFQVLLEKSKEDPEVMEMTRDRLAGYWIKYLSTHH